MAHGPSSLERSPSDVPQRSTPAAFALRVATSRPIRVAVLLHEETVVEWMRETLGEAELLKDQAAIRFIFRDGSSDSHAELWVSLGEELTRFGKPVVEN